MVLEPWDLRDVRFTNKLPRLDVRGSRRFVPIDSCPVSSKFSRAQYSLGRVTVTVTNYNVRKR